MPPSAPDLDVSRASDGKHFVVESLGLTFVLPNTFDSIDDADYLFFAQSMTPRSLFTVDADTPAVTPTG